MSLDRTVSTVIRHLHRRATARRNRECDGQRTTCREWQVSSAWFMRPQSSTWIHEWLMGGLPRVCGSRRCKLERDPGGVARSGVVCTRQMDGEKGKKAVTSTDV